MTASAASLEAADILKLLELLPHRYPFLMVDRIVEIDGDRSGVGLKNVSFNEPHFQGHFPGRPVMPGVLLLEGMAQTAGAMCILARAVAQRPQLVYFMTIDKAKFRKPVTPGDQVLFRMTQKARKRNIWWFTGTATVGDALVAEAELSAMIVES